jgi:hypothetical protein
MIECLKVRGYIPENAYVKVFNLVSCLLLTGFTFYKMFTVEHQMCEFHYDCYGIETMHYYSIPYETYNECIGSSDFSNLIIDYYEQYGDYEKECDDSEYGCCEISNSCQTSYEYNMSTAYYQNHFTLDVGMVNTYFPKNNPEGDNCLTYNDYINFYEYVEIKNVIIIYIIALCYYIIFYSFLSCMKFCKDRDEKEFKPVVQTSSV